MFPVWVLRIRAEGFTAGLPGLLDARQNLRRSQTQISTEKESSMIPRSCWNACLGALVCVCLLAGPAQGSAQQFTQFFTVDCSDPSAQYPTISSALAVAANNSHIYVAPGTTCVETSQSAISRT
jgi:hypothetical protein